ncbi:MAG: HYR domain-containing protein [Lewinellaceae bacterium]|nr:HYR domain-containing protein [Lewinellaceae bacterium]
MKIKLVMAPFITGMSFLLLLLSWQPLAAQIVISQNGNGLSLANSLAGSGATISNVTINAAPGSTGTFSNGNSTNLGLNSGVILTSGKVALIPGLASGTLDNNNNFPGDTNLDDISSGPTLDACVLEFDFVPIGNSVSFQYVFASEEYPDYACRQFNDVFAFFISGGAYSNTNIALIPNTNPPVPVSINTVSNVQSNNIGQECIVNPQYYINNVGQPGPTVQYNAFTTVFTASADVTPCETYHIKLAIADVSDRRFDSGVFLASGSFNVSILCQNVTVNLEPNGTASILASELYSPDNIECSSPTNYEATQTVFDCTDVGPNVVTLTATYPGGLSASCNATVTVAGDDSDEDGVPDVCDPCPLAQDESNIPNFDLQSCGCLPGFYQETTTINGQEVITNCQICPPGTYCPDGVNSYLCEAGYYNPVYGAIACQACPPGKYQGEEGAWQCVNCPPGTYADVEASTHCATCEPGSNTPYAGSVLCEDCTPPSFSTCPVVAAVNNDQGLCGADVTVPSPDLSGLCTRNHALDFDGVDDYVSVSPNPSLDMTGDVSFEAWVYVKGPNSYGTFQSIFDKTETADLANYRFYLTPNGRMGFFNGSYVVISASIVPYGQWVHLAWVLESGTMTFYQNGVQDGTGSTSLGATNNGPLNIGRDNNQTYPNKRNVNMMLDEVRLWNIPRSQADIQATMNLEINTTYSGLVAFFNFNEGIACCDNTGLTTLPNGQNGPDGTLIGFSLAPGCASNWVAGAPALGDPLTLTNNVTGDCASASATYSAGNTIVTWTATGANGQTATCSQTVTVIDNEAPFASCQNITVDLLSTGTYDLTAGEIDNGSSDNCPANLSIAIPATSFNCDDVGNTIAVTLTASDGTNSATCIAQVTVSDVNLYCNQSPLAVCQDISVSASTNCQGTAVASDFDGGSTDPDLDPLTFSVNPEGPYDLGVTNVILTVSDGNGGSDQCSATITVVDDTNPTIACPANITQSNDAGQCSAVVTYATPAGTDNCPLAVTTQTAGLGSGAVFPVGMTTETFKVTDAAGLSAVCSFTITVNDNELPSLTCKPAAILLDGSGNATLSVSDVEVSSSDNCDVSLDKVLSQTTFNCSNVCTGAVDQSAFSSTGLFGPEPDFGQTFTAGASGLLAKVMVSVGGGSPGTLLEIRLNNPSGAVLASQVFDASGPIIHREVVFSTPANLSAGNVYAIRITGPSFYWEGTLYGTYPGGNSWLGLASVSSWDNVFQTFMYNCGTITLTVTDDANNSAICTSMVAVLDEVNPTIVCPADITTGNDAGVCGAVVTYSVNYDDNCSGETLAQSAGQASGSIFPVGTTTNSFTAMDASGNVATCSFSVTVNDDEAPVIHDCPENIVTTTSADGTGDCSTTVSWIVPTVSDNCDEGLVLSSNHNPGAVFGKGMTTVTYDVADNSDNAATTCSFSVTVNDDEVPVIHDCPENIVTTTSADGTGDCSTTVSWIAPTVSDNCDEGLVLSSSHNPGTVFGKGVTTVTYDVADNSGNAAETCSFTVTVNDDEAPVIHDCPDNIVATTSADGTGDCSTTVSWIAPTVSDNCDEGLVLSSNHNPGAVFGKGVTTVTYDVADNSGNAAETCSFTVTVNDDEAPVIHDCPDNIVATTSADGTGDCSTTVSWIAPTASDNCDGGLVLSSSHSPGAVFGKGTTTVTYDVADNSGNAAETCSFSVMVNDDEAPVIHDCPENIVTTTSANGTGDCSTTVSWIAPTASDNCDGGLVLSSSHSPGAVFGKGVTTVTYDVADNSDNAAATCSFSVTVNDSENPTIVCPSDITTGNDAGVCGANVTYTVSYGDNCSVATLAQGAGQGSGSTFPVGTTTNTDGCVNNMTDFTVTVMIQKTTIACQFHPAAIVRELSSEKE